MTLRHVLADVRMFIAFFLALLGLGIIIHGEATTPVMIGSLLGGLGLTSIFLVWLSAAAGEK